VGDDRLCRRVSALLMERHGIYVQPINAPSVRVGEEILRVAPAATHTTSDIEKFAIAIDGIWQELGVGQRRA
jgi:5-aminolevulinate synthase